MPTTTKFYLHDATTGVGGTLPGASTLSATSPTQTVTGASTNRTMDGTISVTSQVSVAFTTLANTSAQPTWIRRFVSEPLGVNDFVVGGGVGTLTRSIMSIGASEQNAASNFEPSIIRTVFLWRPSTGAVVATLQDDLTGTGGEAGTSQTHINLATSFSGSGTSADGDLLVVEWWRKSTAQGMATAYTNTIFYDGTTEGSTSDIASYFVVVDGANNHQAVEMSSGAPAFVPVDPMGASGIFGI